MDGVCACVCVLGREGEWKREGSDKIEIPLQCLLEESVVLVVVQTS